MLQTDVNWDDPALKRWLGSIVRERTRYNYRTAFRAYALFTGMTASALIDEALEDFRKDPRNRKDVVLSRLVQFYNWLKTEYPRKSRGMGEHHIIGKGASDKLAHAYVNSIRSFYATYDVTVRMKGRHKLPRPRVRNKRMRVGAEQVKVLIDHARKPRDRAIILTLFQSGMDVSTLCNLNYGDVTEGLAKNEHPLKLELHRPKTGTEYYTFLGTDAVDALKAYMADMKARGVQFRNGTYLFLKERGKEQLTTNLVQNMMKEVAVNSGFVDKENMGVQLWNTTIGNSNEVGQSSPGAAYGMVYVGTQEYADHSRLYAINSTTGEKIWNFTVGPGKYGSEIYVSPAIADRKVYFGSYDGNLYALNAATGELIWKYKLSEDEVPGGYGLAIADGILFFGTWAESETYGRLVAIGTVSATIDICPQVLTLKSKAKWITAYIELIEGYGVSDIDVSSIMLNNTISVDPDTPTQIGDYDNDSFLDLMVKFDRLEVIALLDTGEATLRITGKVNETSFEGRDTIRLIDK